MKHTLAWYKAHSLRRLHEQAGLPLLHIRRGEIGLDLERCPTDLDLFEECLQERENPARWEEAGGRM